VILQFSRVLRLSQSEFTAAGQYPKEGSGKLLIIGKAAAEGGTGSDAPTADIATIQTAIPQAINGEIYI
jgi:hypothetical protein